LSRETTNKIRFVIHSFFPMESFDELKKEVAAIESSVLPSEFQALQEKGVSLFPSLKPQRRVSHLYAFD